MKENKRKLDRKFNLSYRYIDDLISFNNKRLKEFIANICSQELNSSETTESASVASHLDLLLTRHWNNKIATKLSDNRGAFGFHIVNFSFMSRNIPSAPVYSIYASQVIHMPIVAHTSGPLWQDFCCRATKLIVCVTHYHQIIWQPWRVWLPHCEFFFYVKKYSISTSIQYLCIPGHSHAHCCSHLGALVTRLLLQGYKVNCLCNTLKKFYSRHTDLVAQDKKNVCQMFADSIS